MTIVLDKLGMSGDGSTHSEVIVARTKDYARRLANDITPLSDSIGGTPDTDRIVLGWATAFINEADDSTDLADGTETDAAILTVIDAGMEILDLANAVATAMGIDNVTDSIGGSATDGTGDAVTVAVASAAVGPQAVECEVTRLELNYMLYDLGTLVNKLCRGAGTPELDMSGLVGAGTVHLSRSTSPAIAQDTGTPADPGVKDAAMTAALVQYQIDLVTISTALATVHVLGAAEVIAA